MTEKKPYQAPALRELPTEESARVIEPAKAEHPSLFLWVQMMLGLYVHQIIEIKERTVLWMPSSDYHLKGGNDALNRLTLEKSSNGQGWVLYQWRPAHHSPKEEGQAYCITPEQWSLLTTTMDNQHRETRFLFHLDCPKRTEHKRKEEIERLRIDALLKERGLLERVAESPWLDTKNTPQPT
jgi:hypothetical protein